MGKVEPPDTHATPQQPAPAELTAEGGRTNDELIALLKASPPREICEHGSQKVKCPICENIVLEARVEALEAGRLDFLIWSIVEPHDEFPLHMSVSSDDRERVLRFIKACTHVVRAKWLTTRKEGE